MFMTMTMLYMFMTHEDVADLHGLARLANPRLAKISIGILLATIAGFIISDILQFAYHATTYAVVVDPGNGNVLYKQALPSLLGVGMGHFGMFGQGKMGPWFGGHAG